MEGETKVLIINQYAGTPSYSSGAGERFYYLAPYLKKAGFDVIILSGSFNHLFVHLPECKGLFTEEKIPGGAFVWVKLRKYKGKNFLGRLFSWFEFLVKLFFYRISGPPEIVVVSSMSLFPVIYALYLKRRFGSKFILEVRDIWPLTPKELGGYSKRHPFIFFMERLEKLAYSKADALISVIPGFKKHVAEVLGKEKHASWIPNAIAASPENVVGKTLEKIYLDRSKFNLVYAGAIGIANAVEYIVEATACLKHLPQISISIVGEGPEKLALKKLAESKGLHNLHFFPKVKKQEVASILAQADACIIVWRNLKLYSFGVSANKYNDYMLAGIPVISSSNIAVDPVLMSGGGIQVEAENPVKIAEAIEALYRMSKEEREALGEKGKQFVLATQTYEKVAEKYVTELNNLKWK